MQQRHVGKGLMQGNFVRPCPAMRAQRKRLGVQEPGKPHCRLALRQIFLARAHAPAACLLAPAGSSAMPAPPFGVWP
ncbi:hypothetical protein LJR066_003312 [Acidovorax sp. LjRoot66]|uniref:hypothetical protein n=1 Tax=Acidovorax sp. LjRoot66 TaxID=3342334 RepID=UPI003ECD4B1F